MTVALHTKRINSVDQHPSLNLYGLYRQFVMHYLQGYWLLFRKCVVFRCVATASLDGIVCLWDKRTISATNCVPLAKLQHKNLMHSAHCSPNDGFWLVTVANDSYIEMYNTSSLRRSAHTTTPVDPRLTHDLDRDGRTSTTLCRAWDPKRLNQFVLKW